jgi:predicted acyl esterase
MILSPNFAFRTIMERSQATHLPEIPRMADNDLRGNSWIVPPSRYIQGRPAAYLIQRPRSVYLKMRDGCKIAADIYLPDPVCTENLIRVDAVMESPKLAE